MAETIEMPSGGGRLLYAQETMPLRNDRMNYDLSDFRRVRVNDQCAAAMRPYNKLL